jgi:hypothetical protein
MQYPTASALIAAINRPDD